jgi:hypothetical protein
VTWPSESGDSQNSRHEDNVLIRRLIFVAFFLEVGLLLIVVPWSTFWEQNYFGAWPVVHAIVTNNFVRGGISGLGVVNLVAGFADLSRVFTTSDHVTLTDGSRGPV